MRYAVLGWKWLVATCAVLLGIGYGAIYGACAEITKEAVAWGALYRDAWRAFKAAGEVKA